MNILRIQPLTIPRLYELLINSIHLSSCFVNRGEIQIWFASPPFMAVFIAMGPLAKGNHLKRYDAHLYCHSQPLTCCCLRWVQLSPLDSFIDWSRQPSHWQHRLDKREHLNSALWVWRASSTWFEWMSCWWRKAFYSIFIPSNWLIGWHLTVRWCVRSHLPLACGFFLSSVMSDPNWSNALLIVSKSPEP